MNPLTEAGDGSLLYLKGRPVWGPHLYDLESYAEIRNEVLRHLDTLQQEGGLLVLPFQEETERSALIFLNIIAGKLRQQNKTPFFSQFLGEPYIGLPAQPVNIWFIHQAPRFKNFSNIVETWIKPGRVLLATGLSEIWDQISPRVPLLKLSYFVDKTLSFEREEEKFSKETENQLKTDRLMEEAYHLTSLTDAWGVPLPFDLLARLLKTDGDDFVPLVEKAYQKGLLFWVEREKPRALLISTRGESHARRYLKHLSAEKRVGGLDVYRSILQSIDAEDREERFTVLKLLESWLTHSHFRREIFKERLGINEIRDFVQHGWNRIKLIIRAGTASEQLVWAQCLTQMGLYSQGLEVLEHGLRIDPKNVYLCQAKAHLFSRWSSVEPRKQEDASQAFSKAVSIISENPYLWQAWGVFEAERGNLHAAEKYFQKALKIDPRNLCTLVARADMNLDAGFFDKAFGDLNEAKKINERNLYVQHLEGRLYFNLGKWPDAKKVWEGILTSEKQNLYALHSLGHMARERGQLNEARKHLMEALNCDPENVPALQEKGLLEMDHGFLEESEKVLREALSIEPGNPKTTVSLAVAERLQGKLDAAIERLEKLIQIWPDNLYAHHALALGYLDRDKQDLARQHLQKIINLSQGRNLLAYYSLAEMAIKDRDLEKGNSFLRQAKGAYENVEKFLPAHKKIAALLERGRLLHQMERHEEARTVMDEALKLDPENNRTLKLISELRDSV